MNKLVGLIYPFTKAKLRRALHVVLAAVTAVGVVGVLLSSLGGWQKAQTIGLVLAAFVANAKIALAKAVPAIDALPIPEDDTPTAKLPNPRANTPVICAMILGSLLLSGAACGTNPPTPDPGPAPVDAATPYPFDKMVADCDAPSAQSPSVLSPASSCLAGSNPVDGCMVDLLTTWPADAIACGVRSLGTSTAISVAGGDAGAAPRAAAVAARTWLLIHDVQFRN